MIPALILFVSFVAAARVLKSILPHGLRRKSKSPLHVCLAYQIVSTACMFRLSYLGWYGIVHDPGDMTTPVQRVYGATNTGTTLGYFMANYQLWNFAVSLLIPQYRTVPLLLHHATTALLAFLTTTPYLQTYSLFYCGISEISSIPLAIVDVDKLVDLDRKNLVMISRAVFAILFILLRVVVWTAVNASFYRDMVSLSVLDAYSILFVTSNVGLTGLQYYWASKIVNSARKMMKM